MKVNTKLKPEYIFIILWKSNKENKLNFFWALLKNHLHQCVYFLGCDIVVGYDTASSCNDDGVSFFGELFMTNLPGSLGTATHPYDH